MSNLTFLTWTIIFRVIPSNVSLDNIIPKKLYTNKTPLCLIVSWTPCAIRKGNYVYVELCSNMYHILAEILKPWLYGFLMIKPWFYGFLILVYRSQEILIIWSLLLPIHLKGGPKVIFSQVYVHSNLAQNYSSSP